MAPRVEGQCPRRDKLGKGHPKAGADLPRKCSCSPWMEELLAGMAGWELVRRPRASRNPWGAGEPPPGFRCADLQVGGARSWETWGLCGGVAGR